MVLGYSWGPHTLRGKTEEEGVCEGNGPSLGTVIMEIRNI